MKKNEHMEICGFGAKIKTTVGNMQVQKLRTKDFTLEKLK